MARLFHDWRLVGEEFAQLHAQHHVAFDAQLAGHEGLHAVGLAADDAGQGGLVHDQGAIRVGGVALLDVAGAVLDDHVVVVTALDVELIGEVQAGRGAFAASSVSP